MQETIVFQKRIYEDPNPTRQWLHNCRRDWIMRQLAKATAKRSDLKLCALEIGVGCGLYTRHMVDLGYEVTCVDINADFLNGVAGLGVTTIMCDATSCQFPEADVVLCSEVLEHVEATSSVDLLHSIRASMKRNGIGIITTPQRYSTMELFARLLAWPVFLRLARRFYGQVEELGHINLLTRAEMKRQLAAVGLEILEETHLGLYLPGFAEFTGKFGAAVCSGLASIFKQVPLLDQLLWTQAYVVRIKRG